MTHPLKFLMIVDNPDIARFVSTNGVDTLFVDLEYKGKDQRQPAVDSWKSTQSPADVSRIREAAPEAELLVRINPLDADSGEEIEDALSRGADCIMLPMFTTADEVSRACDLIRGRAIFVPLFETAASLRALPEVLQRIPLNRGHIGLNDLHLDLGARFMFEPLVDGKLEEPCDYLRAAGVSFGIGGIARVGEGILDAALLIGEHVRLGSSRAILSRTFHRNARSLEELQHSTDFAAEIAKLRRSYDYFAAADESVLEENRQATANRAHDVVRLLHETAP